MSHFLFKSHNFSSMRFILIILVLLICWEPLKSQVVLGWEASLKQYEVGADG